ncbi:hypothetical protein [Photobacterium sp. OFAV2-7]|uniref:hypothetical protein n=1 Tax=Photobacterium sp. OFAV2-7 TaxID=2917748 RepID=UPI001EF6FBC0|nr:hypothetical protein [Photobacterium sp. OFAV2-7]MCG7588220.1 hypothetical protein [Photobacterium sp. OFAV2-7]
MKAIGFKEFCSIVSQKWDLHPTSLRDEEEFDSFASFLNAQAELIITKRYKVLLLGALIFAINNYSCNLLQL